MYNFEAHTADKNEIISKMEAVRVKISELERFGIDVRESVRKIENAKDIVTNDKISVVLVGAFSDGKTSVAAGWLNEKFDNMKIDSDESSDEILCYTPASIPEGCQIVDTPGLFGDKVDGDRICLSEKTTKYISEANMILYVVTAKNPIKDSHKEFIKKLMKDLNKLSTTIFVINRMDDVADLTDDDDFAMQARIKADNLRGKLSDCGLTFTEAQNVNIACISAAPDGKGIEIWKDNREEYLRRSRLSTLEDMTNTILQNSREHLIVKTGCDILNDEIRNTVYSIQSEANALERVIPEQRETIRRNIKDLDKLGKRIRKSKGEVREELRRLEKSKLVAIRAATMENFKDIIDDEIGIISGKEGYRLDEDINNIFERYCDLCSEWSFIVGESIQSEYNKQNEMIQSLLSDGGRIAVNGLKGFKIIGTDAIKKGIFFGRDILGKMGKNIKFKPWQVTKMANFATKALPVIGAGLEIALGAISNIIEAKRNKEFQKKKEEIMKEIKLIFNEVVDSLNDDDRYIEEFAPEYILLSDQIKNDEASVDAQEQLLLDIKEWEKSINESDFTFC